MGVYAIKTIGDVVYCFNNYSCLSVYSPIDEVLQADSVRICWFHHVKNLILTGVKKKMAMLFKLFLQIDGCWHSTYKRKKCKPSSLFIITFTSRNFTGSWPCFFISSWISYRLRIWRNQSAPKATTTSCLNRKGGWESFKFLPERSSLKRRYLDFPQPEMKEIKPALIINQRSPIIFTIKYKVICVRHAIWWYSFNGDHEGH